MVHTSPFISFDKVKLRYNYVVYCPAGEDILSFSDDISQESLQQKLRMSRRMIDAMKDHRGLMSTDHLEIGVWTKPFNQKDYAFYLYKYTMLSTGKGCYLGTERDLQGSGWTKHTITI